MDGQRTMYSRGAIAFHWTIGTLIVINLALGLLHDSVDKGTGAVMMGFHKPIGILVILLTIGRVLWRVTHRPPALPASVKPWEKGLAHGVHWVLYALMLAIPITGWLMVSAGTRKWPISAFGLFDVPFLGVVQDKAASHIYGDRHEQLSWLLIALLVLHIAGAAKHHLFDKDNTLARIAPWVRWREAR